MNRTRQHIAVLFVLIFAIGATAQQRDPHSIIEAIIESHIENLDEGTDAVLIIEDLEDLAEHPVNINSTNAVELSRLYLLSTVQINKLLDFVRDFGPVLSIFELNTIDGFTPDLLRKMQPFIRFGPAEEEKSSFGENMKKGKHEVLARTLGTLQTAKGYLPREDGTTPYEGNRFRYYSRYRFEARDALSAGVTTEKDPGEAFFDGSNKQGFDYYSAHLSWTPGKFIQQITVGDFVVRAGQGLALWQGYTSGKSPDVLSILKTGQGTRPYTSVDENAFFRGAAAVLKYKKNSATFFISSKKADGNVETDEEGNNWFTSLQSSGYHRTQSEIEDEKTIQNLNAGFVYQLNLRDVKFGATFVYQHFDQPFIRSAQLHNQFLFSGNENYTAGIDYLFSRGKYQFFGEAAVSRSGGMALIQGTVVRLNDRVNVSLLYRHFDKNYHALWANTFADGTNTNNESGLYFGLRFLPAKFVTLSAYSDIYRSKWYSFSTAGPSTGWDVLSQADFRFSEKFSFYIRYKNEERDQKYILEKQYVNLTERIQKTRLHFDYRITETIQFKTRFEHAYFNGNSPENGILIFEDVQYNSLSFPISFSARLAWFRTDGYNSRIYAYENDLLYTFSIPAYYEKGFRTYLNAKYRISGNAECWIKFGNTLWAGRESISSGYNEIDGHNKSELKVQLRLKF